MPQYIQLPDGSTAEFPDGMSDSQIEAAISQSLGGPPAAPQMTGALREPALAGSSFLHGLESGVGSILDVGRSLAGASTAPAIGTPASRGGAFSGAGDTSVTPPAGGYTNALTGLTRGTLTERPDLVPQGTGERYLAAASEGTGAAVPSLLLPGSAPVALLSGAAGGAGGEAAHELFPNSKYAPAIGGTLAGGGVGLIDAVTALPKLEQAASQLGVSQTLQEAGKYAQDSARSWLTDTLPTRLDAIWTPVRTEMAGAPVPLDNFEKALAGMTSKGGSLQDVVAKLSPKLPGQLQDAFNNTTASLGVPASWEDVSALRTALGDARYNPTVVKDIPAQQLDALYKSVTQDMQAAASAKSPQALDLFNSANSESSNLYQFAEKTLGKIVSGSAASSKDVNPEVAASRLLSAGRKGGSDLEALRAELPDALDELGAAHIRTAGQGGWTKLSPEAREALVSDPNLRAAIDKAATAQSMTHNLTGLSLETLAGGGLGEMAGIVGGHMLLPGDNPLYPGALTGLILGGAPIAYRGARAIAQNPLILRSPAIGGFAGQNAVQGRP